MAQALGPGGESVPGGGLADGEADLLYKDEEGAGPERGAVNFARRPQIVSCENKQKTVGDQRRNEGFSLDESERPSGDGGDRDTDGGNDDDAFVGGGIEAGAESEKDQHGEDEHVRHRNHVKGL